jgi:hypothetical protein
MSPNALYYGSIIPITVGVFMAYKAGKMEGDRDARKDTWTKAVDDGTVAGG